MLCALAVDALCIEVAFIGCWRGVHWALTLCALLINTECFDCWCSVRWLLILLGLMLMLFAMAAVTTSIGCWLMPPTLIFLCGSYAEYWTRVDLIMPFISAYFNELVSSSTLTPPSCHSARRVYPELQNPLFPKAKQNLFPRGRRYPKGGWGGRKRHFKDTPWSFPKPFPSPSTSSFKLLYWDIMITKSIKC